MTRIIGIFSARTLPIAPTGKEMQTLSTNNYISRFFLCLQHQYIGARWLVAPMHLMLQYQHIPIRQNTTLKFGGYGNMFITSWRHSREAEECRAHGHRELLKGAQA
jgi:hypothetical protein